jgi:hypothetical protein
VCTHELEHLHGKWTVRSSGGGKEEEREVHITLGLGDKLFFYEGELGLERIHSQFF